MIPLKTFYDNKLRFFSMFYPLETLTNIIKDFRSGRLPTDRFLRRFPFFEVTDPGRVSQAYGSQQLVKLRKLLTERGTSPLLLCPYDVLVGQRDMLRDNKVVDRGESCLLNSLDAVEAAIAKYDTKEAGNLRREEFFYWLGVECMTAEQLYMESDLFDIIKEENLERNEGLSFTEPVMEYLERIMRDNHEIREQNKEWPHKLRPHKYFVTDDHLKGAMVVGYLEPPEMLLLLGAICLDTVTVKEIVRILEEQVNFSVEVENITFAEVNDHIRYPYACGELAKCDDSVGDVLYCYSNVLDIQRRFFGAEEMLRSLDCRVFKKLNFP